MAARRGHSVQQIGIDAIGASLAIEWEVEATLQQTIADLNRPLTVHGEHAVVEKQLGHAVAVDELLDLLENVGG